MKTFYIIIFLFLFEFSASASVLFDPICANSEPKCSPGKEPYYSRFCFRQTQCISNICRCKTIGQAVPKCPAGSTQAKRAVAIASSYTIRCGPARAYPSDYRGSRDPWTQGSTLRSAVPGRPSPRMCWAESSGAPGRLRVSMDKLRKNGSHCDFSWAVGGYRNFSLHVICDGNTDGDKACKKTLRDMIEGRVTFKPGQSMTYANRHSYCCGRGDSRPHCTAPLRPNRFLKSNNNKPPRHACSVELYDRSAGPPAPFTPKKYVTLYTDGSRAPLFGPYGDLILMQCLADNTDSHDVCECNNSDHEFSADSDEGDCYCTKSDGTQVLKNNDGSCPVTESTCPQGSSLDKTESDVNRKCVCTYGCPSKPGAYFSVRVALSASACPADSSTNVVAKKDSAEMPGGVCEPDTTDGGTDGGTGLCPNEAPWNHPNVTSSTAANTDATDQERCRGTGGVYIEDAGVSYCERDHTCVADTRDIQACTAGTEETDHGACTKIGGGGVVESCKWLNNPTLGLTGTSAPMETTPPVNGMCPLGSYPLNLPNLRGDCTFSPPIPTDTDKSKESNWSCSSYINPNSIGVIFRSGDTYKCHCRSGGSVEYVCDGGGEPSSQDALCRCKTSVNTETCPAGYSKSSSSLTTSACTASNCPTGWTLSGSTCTHTPLTQQVGYVTKRAYYEAGGAIDPVVRACHSNARFAGDAPPPSPGSPATIGAARADGWDCTNHQDFSSAGGTFHACMCTKQGSPIKKCPDGIEGYNPDPDGDPNTNDERCETPCTPDQTVNNCQCVKDTETETCSCPSSWTPAAGDKCRMPAPTSSQEKTCTCKFFCPHFTDKDTSTDPNDVEFKPEAGDLIYDAIMADLEDETTPLINNPRDLCVADQLNCRDCCHQCETYPGGCPSSIPVPDNRCPDDPTCTCIGGNRLCSDGTCPDSTTKECSQEGPFSGGNPRGIDIAFDSSSPGSIYSVYSAGSALRPDYICWQKGSGGQSSIKVQNHSLLCPPPEDCGGEVCKCRSFDAQGDSFPVENTSCEYASRDPMRLEEGIVRGELPASRKTDKYKTNIRFFKQTTIVSP